MRRRVRTGTLDQPTAGSSGPRVRGMQRVLNELGYAGDTPLVEDGQLGPVTAAALAAAQAELGVDEPGTLGPATRAALRAKRDGPAGPRRRVRTP